MKILDLQQGSDDWLALRSELITATDIPVLMGENPWMNAQELFRKKMGLLKTENNAKMKKGSDMEPQAMDNFSKIVSREYRPAVVQSSETSYIMASLDGLSMCNCYTVEIKCGKASHEIIKAYQVPSYYIGQLQCQMHCTGLEKTDLFSYLDEENFTLLEVKRDDDYIEKMLERAKAFYDCLINLQIPDLYEFMSDKQKKSLDSYEDVI